MKFAMELSNAFGPSGYEFEVKELIKKELDGSSGLVFKSEPLGSLIVEKRGKISGPGIVLSAHMDEVGFIISKINDDGTLSFRPIGGIDKRILPAKNIVIGKDRLPGIIMYPPVHLHREESVTDIKDLRIFIGTSSEDEAKEKVSLGDYATFATGSRQTGNRLYGKAWDDRIGCYVLAEILKKNWDINICGVFTVQEEVGLRGIQSALHYIKAEFSYVLEGTTSYEIDDDDFNSPSTRLDHGPAITFMDRRAIGSQSLKKLLEEIAKKEGIPFQYKQTVTGGTETFFHVKNKTGMQSICVSVPVRYIHSPIGICSKSDVENTIKLIETSMRLLEKKIIKMQGGK